jgi:hypothetical protein
MTPQETLETLGGWIREVECEYTCPVDWEPAIRAVLEENERLKAEAEHSDAVAAAEIEKRFAAELKLQIAEDEVQKLQRRHSAQGPTRAEMNDRIEAALALRLKNLEATCPCIVSEEPNCNHGADVDLIVKALRGENGEWTGTASAEGRDGRRAPEEGEVTSPLKRIEEKHANHAGQCEVYFGEPPCGVVKLARALVGAIEEIKHRSWCRACSEGRCNEAEEPEVFERTLEEVAGE